MNVYSKLQSWKSPCSPSITPSEPNDILVVLVVDEVLRIVAMGPEQDLDAAGLQVVLGRLSTGSHQTDINLRRYLAEGVRRTIRLKQIGEITTLLSLLPMATSGADRCPKQAFLVLWALPPASGNIPAVQAAFNLTSAETHVLHLIFTGLNTVETARHLGLAVSTVRTHLYHIFGKTRTSRQSELVYLVSTFSRHDTQPQSFKPLSLC